jgi:hypothetical protein
VCSLCITCRKTESRPVLVMRPSASAACCRLDLRFHRAFIRLSLIKCERLPQRRCALPEASPSWSDNPFCARFCEFQVTCAGGQGPWSPVLILQHPTIPCLEYSRTLCACVSYSERRHCAASQHPQRPVPHRLTPRRDVALLLLSMDHLTCPHVGDFRTTCPHMHSFEAGQLDLSRT